jgi:hypothetical protein
VINAQLLAAVGAAANGRSVSFPHLGQASVVEAAKLLCNVMIAEKGGFGEFRR